LVLTGLALFLVPAVALAVLLPAQHTCPVARADRLARLDRRCSRRQEAHGVVGGLATTLAAAVLVVLFLPLLPAVS